MRLLAITFSISALVFSAACAAAVAPPSARNTGLSQDTRLQTWAEGDVPGRALGAMLERAAKATGVPLSADPGCADQKVILVVRSQRIGKVLDLLSNELGYRWIPLRTGQSGGGYRLIMPKERKGLGARLRVAAERERTRRIVERLDLRLRYINASPQVLSRLRTQDPLIETAARNAPIRARLHLASLLTPIERRRVAADQAFVSPPLAQLSRDIQAAALVAGGLRSDSVDLSKLRYTIRRESDDGADHLRVRLLGPDGRPVGRSSDLVPTDSPRRGAAIPVVKSATDPSRKSPDPAFQRPAQLVDKRGRPLAIHEGLPPLLAGIARASGFDVLSDYYAGQKPRFAVEPLGQRPLWQLLNIVAEQYCLKWERRGSFLLFRHREWFEMDVEEIPERLLHTWTTPTSKPETVAPGDFVNVLGQLTPGQLRGLRFQFPGLVLEPPYSWEQWLGALDPPQRLELVAGNTVRDEDLNRNARGRLLALFRRAEGRLPEPTSVRLRVEKTGIVATAKSGVLSAEKRWALPAKSPAPRPITLRLTAAR